MRGKRAPLICVALFCIILCFTACAANDEKTIGDSASSTAPNDTFYDGVSSTVQNNTFYEGVSSTVPDNKLLTADFWISQTSDANTLLMTQSEIANLNQKLVQGYRENGIMYDLEGFGETISGSMLTKWIGEEGMPKGDCYIGDTKVDAAYFGSALANRNLAAVKAVNPVRYGIVTQRGMLRSLPTDDAVTDEKGDLDYDMLAQTVLLYGEPLLILHESQDAGWYYIVMNNYRGWIKTDSVAICADKEQWLTATKPENYLTVTANSLTLDETPYIPEVSGLRVTMGTRLALAEDQNAAVDSRMPTNCFVLKVYVRESDGSCGERLAALPISSDVCKGSLPYTRANVITLAFKTLGQRYGWSGMNGERDCSSLLLEIYRCFGFEFARNAGQQAKANCETVSLAELDTAAKKEALSSLKAGACLYMSGHAVLYLGEYDGRQYVINATGGFAPEGTAAENAPGQILRVRCVTVNSLDVVRKSGKTWLEDLTVAKVYENSFA